MQENLYLTHLLPGVDYQKLKEDRYRPFGELTDVEYATMQNLCEMVHGMKEMLKQDTLVQVSELIVAQRCGYLGFLSVIFVSIK